MRDSAASDTARAGTSESGYQLAVHHRAQERKMIEKAVLVTTAHRGVFFGYAEKTDGETIQLKRARNCIYWPPSNHGFGGLAVDGPHKGARIGPASSLIELRNVTSWSECSEEAGAAWEAAPWSK